MKLPLKKSTGKAIPFVAGVVVTAAIFGAVLLIANFSDKSTDHAANLDRSIDSDVGQGLLDGSPASQSGIASDSIGNLYDLSQLDSDFARTVALHRILIDSNSSDLNLLIEQSMEMTPKSRQHSTQEAIFQRYATINPANALVRIENLPGNRHDSLVSVVFREWSQLDLDNAVAKARQLAGSKKLAALNGILQSRDDLSEDLRLGIARDIGSEQFAIDFFTQSQMSESIEDPQATWNMLVNDDHDDIAQVAMLVEVAQKWVEQSGFSALQEINESLSNWQSRMAILGSVVHRLAQSDPEGLFAEVLNYDNDRGNFIATTLVQAWVGSDAHAALDAVVSVESESLRRTLLESIVNRWAYNDPHAVLEAIELFPEETRNMGRRTAIIAMARTSPEEAASLMSTVSGNNTRWDVARSIAGSWSRQDVYGALDWVLGSQDVQSMQNRLLEVVLNELTRVDPQLAMETALQQPISGDQRGLESVVIARLANIDMQKAIEMLSQVRDGQTKSAAYAAVGSALARNGDIDKALKLASSLSDRTQTYYYQSVVSAWGRRDPQDLLASMDRLPSPQVKSRAAMTMLFNSRWQRDLTEEQLDYARSFLTEQDARTMERTRSRGGNWQRNSGGGPTSFRRSR